MAKREEIDILKEATDLENLWKDRNTQILLDRELVYLRKPEKKTTDKIQWVLNEPKVFFETAKALVSSYPARYRIPLSKNFDAEEKSKISMAERFLIGIFRSLDYRVQEIGDPNAYWLRGLAHWVLSGWYAIFSYIKRDGDRCQFRADFLDPLTVFPEWDDYGLKRCVRSYEISPREASILFDKFAQSGLRFDRADYTGESSIKIVNWWRRDRAKTKKGIQNKVYNAIVAGSTPNNTTIAKPITLEKDYDHIPILVGSVGNPEKSASDWAIRCGEHICAANRDMYDYTNTLTSLMATILAETAYPNIVSTTKTGQTVTKGGLKGYGQEVPLKLNEKLETLKHASTPEEVNLLLSLLAQQKQKGALPDIVYGGVPVELSGFAISQLMAAIKYKLAPYLRTMQLVTGKVATNFLRIYKRGNYPAITLDTVDPTELRKGLFFIEEFTPADVPDVMHVEVTIPITSALDKTQQIIFARQALQPPQLLSRESLWDEVLDVQDAEQEYARILQDETLELPIVKQIMMIEQLKERMAMFKAAGRNAEAEALNRYIMMLEMGLGMRKGVPAQPGQPGVPSNVAPPEMGQSPDATRAAIGVSPPGLKRRPQTSAEREASKGRKGTLVSPSGETLLEGL